MSETEMNAKIQLKINFTIYSIFRLSRALRFEKFPIATLHLSLHLQFPQRRTAAMRVVPA